MDSSSPAGTVCPGSFMLTKLAALPVTVRVEDTALFLRAAAAAGWSAVDSGDRIRTPEGIDKAAILLVRIPESA